MKNIFGRYTLIITLFLTLLLGQVVSYAASPASWLGFVNVLVRILSMIAFWGRLSC